MNKSKCTINQVDDMFGNKVIFIVPDINLRHRIKKERHFHVNIYV